MREAREEFTGWVVCEGVFCISKRFFQYLTIITVESFESTIVQLFVEVSLFFLSPSLQSLRSTIYVCR